MLRILGTWWHGGELCERGDGGEPHEPACRPRRRPAVLGWALWVLTLLGLAVAAWLDRLLRQAGRPELVSLPPSSISQVVAAVSAATVGAVLAARRPRHPVGWLLLGVGLSIGAHALTFGYTRYGLVARPGALPAAGYLAGFDNGVVLSWIACAGFVLLLAPTGRLPSPRWRWWARTAAAAALVWLLASVVHPTPLYPEYPAIGNPLAVPAIPAGWRSPTGRRRRGTRLPGRGGCVADGALPPRPRRRAAAAALAGLGGGGTVALSRNVPGKPSKVEALLHGRAPRKGRTTRPCL